MVSEKQISKCVRCRQTGKPFKDGVKTCIPCLEQKAEYQRTPAGRIAHNKAKKKWRQTENGKKLLYAHVYVGTALKRGKLQRKPCEVCGDTKVEGHHDDYDKRLEVRWLCHAHHLVHHRSTRNAVV